MLSSAALAGKWKAHMRSKLIGLLIGCGLAAIVATALACWNWPYTMPAELVAPALACSYGTTAQNGQSTSQQTAQSQPASDTGSN